MNLRRIVFSALGVSLLLGFSGAVARAETAAKGPWLKFSSSGSVFSLLLGSCSLEVRQEPTSWTYVAVGHSGTEFRGFWPTEPGIYRVSSTTRREATLLEQERFQINEELEIKFELVRTRLLPVSYTYIRNPDDPQSMRRDPTCVGLEPQ